MAKKKGGGSNLGLIITLVFFVLSTVILGVTTYMGFSELDTKEKAKNDAIKEKGVAENNAKYMRLLYLVARLYIGEPAGGVELADVARERDQFKKGQFQPASNQKDKDEVSKWLDSMDAKTKFDPAANTAPAQSLNKMLSDKESQIDLLKKQVAAAEKARDDAKREAAEEKDGLEKTIAGLNKALTAVKDEALKHRKGDLDDIAKKSDDVRKEADKQKKLREDLAKALEDNDKLDKSLAKEKKAKQVVADERDRIKRDLDEEKRIMQAVLARYPSVDLSQVQARDLTYTAKEKLKNWHKTGKRWQVVYLDKTGAMPYINLGSRDRVRPQMTFSIHGVLPDGSLNPIPKGTLEVVRIMREDMSQAKITSTTDAKKDPILKGDRLFHATWDPDKKTRVVIAGLVDLDGDRTDGTQRFIRMLEKQNVQVDAYIDASDDKAPRLVEKTKGKAVSIDTEYLILGYNVNSLKHSKQRDADYVKQMEALRTKLQDAAKDNAVKIVRLADFMEMIGVSGGVAKK